MMDYQSFIGAGLVGLYLLACSPRRFRDSLLALLGSAVPGGALAWYHTANFGGPLVTGYSLSNPVHEQGFLGLVGPSRESLWFTLLDPSNGLLILTPWMVVAIVGFVVVMADRGPRQRCGAEAVVCVLVLAAYLLFMASLVPSFSRAGWCIGPRYMTMALPFVAWLAIPGFALLERWAAPRALVQGLVVASAVIFVVGGTTYPHWPEGIANPLYELVFKLLWKGYAVHSLGTLVGLTGLAAILPLYLLAGGMTFWMMSRGGWRGPRTTAVAFAMAAVIIAGHRLFPTTGPYADRAFSYITATWEPARR
jgi:hypothetical protein